MRLSLTEIETEYAKVVTERDLLLLNLKTLCGGVEIAYLDTEYDSLINLILDYHNSLSSLQKAQNEQIQIIAEKDLELTKSEYIPSIRAGYMAELAEDEKWNGVTIGISIPLWNNRHNLKRAKLQVQSAKSEAEDAAYKLEQAIASQKLITVRYKEIAQNMQQKLLNASSTTLLRKALSEGQISLIEYCLENSEIFTMRIKSLEAERDYQQDHLYLSAMF